MKILICAGGTGGGIYPALAAVSELENLGIHKSDILWVGVRGEMEERLVPRAGIRLELIDGGPIAGVSRREQLKNGIKLLRSIFTGGRLMAHFKPDVVFVTGGYMSVPIAVAAWLRRIPAVVYLPDLEPGAAIKTISRLVTHVTATFDESRRYFPTGKPFTATGYPVRASLKDAADMPKAEATAVFDLSPTKQTLFVFGGSRGAWHINQALIEALPTLLPTTQVIHISGTLTWEQVKERTADLPADLRPDYRPFPYLHEQMGAAFRAADLVVARAGASMLGESPLFGVPAVLVPYPHAWRYQKVNADYLTDQNAAVRLNDDRLDDEFLPTVLGLLQNKERLREMGENLKRLRTPRAAHNLAQTIIHVGQKKE